MHKFTIELADPIISIKSGQSGHIVQVDVRKIPANVLSELLRQGVIKPLTDISKNWAKEETDLDLHKRRQAKVANWYAGDFSVRGGGVADPVAVQMREEIIQVYINGGASRKEAEKHVKGSAAQFIASQAESQPEAEREAWVADRMAHYRKLAEATLASRRKSADKLDISKLKI